MSIFRRQKTPSPFWSLVEGRAIFELQSFYALQPLLKRLPKGDGHTVIVFPGFVASDVSTKPMRSMLQALGYSARGWGLGRNLSFNDSRESEMRAVLKKAYHDSGRKVSLIGWSLGGIYAREVAKANPEYVRCVITLGSPVSGNSQYTNARFLFSAINGKANEARKARDKTIHIPPPLPTTSIYTKTDGVVAWRGCVQPKAPMTENIRVPASHLGLGVNPMVLAVVANRLVQTEGNWRPYKKDAMRFSWR